MKKKPKKSEKQRGQDILDRILAQGTSAAGRELRLKCLNVAIETEGTTETVLKAAQAFFDFVTGAKTVVVPESPRAPARVVTLGTKNEALPPAAD